MPDTPEAQAMPSPARLVKIPLQRPTALTPSRLTAAGACLIAGQPKGAIT